jgi:hypothetical protein
MDCYVYNASSKFYIHVLEGDGHLYRASSPSITPAWQKVEPNVRPISRAMARIRGTLADVTTVRNYSSTYMNYVHELCINPTSTVVSSSAGLQVN